MKEKEEKKVNELMTKENERKKSNRGKKTKKHKKTGKNQIRNDIK